MRCSAVGLWAGRERAFRSAKLLELRADTPEMIVVLRDLGLCSRVARRQCAHARSEEWVEGEACVRTRSRWWVGACAHRSGAKAALKPRGARPARLQQHPGCQIRGRPRRRAAGSNAPAELVNQLVTSWNQPFGLTVRRCAVVHLVRTVSGLCRRVAGRDQGAPEPPPLLHQCTARRCAPGA